MTISLSTVPPIINTLTINVLNVADEVIAPIKVDRGAEKGLIMTIRELMSIANSYDLEMVVRPLFTMVQRFHFFGLVGTHVFLQLPACLLFA